MTATYDGPRAIETHYAGYRFRSRLEARWAVFFDAIGAAWTYEEQGYHLEDGPYLPDFEVDLLGRHHFEIKGDLRSSDLSKALALCVEQEEVVVIASNIPRPGLGSPDVYLLSPSAYSGGYGELHLGSFLASRNGPIRLEPFGWARLVLDANDLLKFLTEGDLAEVDGCVRRPRRVDQAFSAARSARFEHGETPGSIR